MRFQERQDILFPAGRSGAGSYLPLAVSGRQKQGLETGFLTTQGNILNDLLSAILG